MTNQKFEVEFNKLTKLRTHYKDTQFKDEGKAMMPLAYAIWGGDPAKVGTVAKATGAVVGFLSLFVTGVPGKIAYKFFNNTDIKIKIIEELREIIRGLNGHSVRSIDGKSFLTDQQILEKYKEVRGTLLKTSGSSATYHELLEIADKLDHHFGIEPSMLNLNSINLDCISPKDEEKSLSPKSYSLTTFRPVDTSSSSSSSSSSSVSSSSSSSSSPPTPSYRS